MTLSGALMRAAALTICATLFPLLAAVPPTTSGRESLRNELTRQVPECSLVAENGARLLASGVNEADVLAEWRNICPNSDFIHQYELSGRLATIDKTSPDISWNLWMTIRGRKDHRRLPPADGEYYRLLAKRAALANPTSIDGKLLKTYFLSGRTAFESELERTSGGRFHEFATKQQTLKSDLSTVFLAYAGAWLPQGNLSRLGAHPSMGFQSAIGVGRFYVGMAMDFRFGNSAEEYRYYDLNTKVLTATNNFFGIYIAADIRWDFLHVGNASLMLAGAFGYDLISHRSVPRYSGLRPSFSDSFNINGGLVFRQYFSASRNGFAEIDVRVHKVQFTDGGLGGDDLSGYYFTVLAGAGYRISFDD